MTLCAPPWLASHWRQARCRPAIGGKSSHAKEELTEVDDHSHTKEEPKDDLDSHMQEEQETYSFTTYELAAEISLWGEQRAKEMRDRRAVYPGR